MLDASGGIFGIVEFAYVPFSSSQVSCDTFGFLRHQEGFSNTGKKMYRKMARNFNGFNRLYLFLNTLILFFSSSDLPMMRRYLLLMPLSSLAIRVLRLTSLLNSSHSSSRRTCSGFRYSSSSYLSLFLLRFPVVPVCAVITVFFRYIFPAKSAGLLADSGLTTTCDFVPGIVN